MRRVLLPMVALGLMLIPMAARADSKEDQIRADKMQEVSEKFLMLRGAPPKNETGMADDVFKWLLGSIEQLRFNIRDWTPNSDDTTKFCQKGAADAALKADEVTAKGDQGLATMERVLKRCSEIGQEWFVAKHACPYNAQKSEYNCEVDLTITIKKYKAHDKGDGTFDIVPDPAFGTAGTMIITSSGTGSDRDEHTALQSAAFLTRLFAERDVRDVEMFQLRAPVQANDGTNTRFCLGQDSVELDTPFYVLKPTEGGVDRVGFVKARKIFDGCWLTSELKEAQDKGTKVDLQPLIAENILGRDDIQEGMTAWEMPSVGLNLGVGFATMGHANFGDFGNTFSGSFDPAGVLLVEYDLARHIGISEFWAQGGLRFGAYNVVGAGADAGAEKQLDIQLELGVLKRWYLVGPLFADVGGGITTSYNYKYNVQYPYEAGAYAKLGLGVQMSGRFLMRLAPEFRYAYNYVNKDAPHDGGLVLGLDVMYTY